MTQRITDEIITTHVNRVTALLREQGVTAPITFHKGNSSYKITNKLVVGAQNMWPDAMAGYTRRDAYNALRIMTATLSEVFEAQEGN